MSAPVPHRHAVPLSYVGGRTYDRGVEGQRQPTNNRMAKCTDLVHPMWHELRAPLLRPISIYFVTGWRKPGWRRRCQKCATSAGSSSADRALTWHLQGGASTYKVEHPVGHIFYIVHIVNCSKIRDAPVTLCTSICVRN